MKRFVVSRASSFGNSSAKLLDQNNEILNLTKEKIQITQFFTLENIIFLYFPIILLIIFIFDNSSIASSPLIAILAFFFLFYRVVKILVSPDENTFFIETPLGQQLGTLIAITRFNFLRYSISAEYMSSKNYSVFNFQIQGKVFGSVQNVGKFHKKYLSIDADTNKITLFIGNEKLLSLVHTPLGSSYNPEFELIIENESYPLHEYFALAYFIGDNHWFESID